MRSLDVQPRLRAAVAPPVSSFGLKEVATAFGYRYQHPDLDGLAVAAEYLYCVRTGRPIPNRLLEYNRDDLLSLRHLIEEIARLCDGVGVATASRQSSDQPG
jgi:predicted RecB family nuclease